MTASKPIDATISALYQSSEPLLFKTLTLKRKFFSSANVQLELLVKLVEDKNSFTLALVAFDAKSSMQRIITEIHFRVSSARWRDDLALVIPSFEQAFDAHAAIIETVQLCLGRQS